MLRPEILPPLRGFDVFILLDTHGSRRGLHSHAPGGAENYAHEINGRVLRLFVPWPSR
jgi:hypothetical protein